MNGWQDMMNLIYTCYCMGKHRQAVAIREEAWALRHDIAKLRGAGRFFEARWPRHCACPWCFVAGRN